LKLLIDTWGWITLTNKRERRHEKVKIFYEEFRHKKGILYTTDYILNEAITLLFRHLPFETAREGLDRIERGIGENYLILEWTTKERFNKAMGLRLRFKDKPRISFTDLTSMVVMKELRIKDVLTEDAHFTQVGMGFRKVP
jgi:predicted nucleic acid-binding protein